HTTRLLVVGEGHPYGRQELARSLGVRVLGSVEFAPDQARVYSHGQPPPVPPWWRRVGRGPDAAGQGFTGSAYVRSLRATAEALVELSDAASAAATRGVPEQLRVSAGGRRDE
ncbi:MAG: hypothetical protein VB036_08650, partial [Propionicimonas sp.]|nr:hypothetical protein [Propionicimonas sp.]